MQIENNYATVVSIVPFNMEEYKPGIYPGFFQIPACVDEPQILVVGESIHFIEVDPDRSVPVTNPPYKVAKSIVDDYISSSLQADSTAGPGLFWKVGKYTLEMVKKECKEELEDARRRQTAWFLNLVKLADDDWEKTRQHKFISDLQRFAARALNLDRPWLIEVSNLTTKRCPACGNNTTESIVVCPTCRCILDKEKYDTLQFAG